MNAQSARQVLLVRAVEEADADHVILDRSTRERATRAARAAATEPEAILVRRAEILCERAELGTLTQPFNLVKMLWVALVPAVLLWLLVSGLSKGLWAADKSINILIVPLLVLFVWNALYVIGQCIRLVRVILPGVARKPSLVERVVTSLSSKLSIQANFAEKFASSHGGETRTWHRILLNYFTAWLTLARPLYTARLQFALHIAACVLVFGEFAYVYLRGIAVEFLAAWESTWLTAQATRDLLEVVLWPAWLMIGDGLPTAAAIAKLKIAPTNAAYWINLYLAQACVVVFVPRLVLATLAYVRTFRMETSFPLSLNDRYYQNLIHAERGQGVVARVLPYSFQPTTKTRDAIHDLLASDLGYSAHIDITESLAYGDLELPTEERESDTGSRQHVLLFNLAQTPETEVHGELIASATHRASTNGDRLAVIVDARAYRDRLAGEPERDTRLESRRAAWSTLAAEQGVTAVFLDVDQDTSATIPWKS